MSNEIKLLPCPFCGREAQIRYTQNDWGDQYIVECINCGCEYYGDTEKDIIKQWNTRKPIDRIVEQLQKAESVKCYGSRNSGNYMIPLADAIDIVKAGGSSE